MTTVELLNGIEHDDEIIEEEQMELYNLIYINEIKEDFKYDKCYYFYNGHALVLMNQKFGLINRHGKEILPCKFDFIGAVVNNFIVASKEDFEYFYDKEGDLVTEKGYYDCHPFSSNRAGFRDPSTLLCGFIDENGKEIIKPKYLEVEPYFNDYAAVLSKDNLKYGLIDKSGKKALENKYIDIRVLNEGLIAVKSSKLEKWGYVDLEDNLVIPFMYDYATTFEEDKAIVRKEDNYYIINKNNKVIDEINIHINEEKCEDFIFNSKHLYPYQYIDRILYIQNHINFQYKNNPFHLYKDDNGKISVMNKDKNPLSDYIFDSVSDFVYEDIIIANCEGKSTHINQDGKFLGLRDKVLYSDNNKIRLTPKYYGLKLFNDKNDKIWFTTEEERKEFLEKNPHYRQIKFIKTKKLN